VMPRIICGEESEIPVEEPTAVCPKAAPTFGQRCSDETRTICEYNPYTCPGETSVIYTSLCFCDKDTSIYICMAVGVLCQPPALIETAPPLPIDPVGCIACSDEPDRGMVRRKKTCDGMRDRQLEKKCKKEKWIRKNTCQLSCDTAGYGYNNESCCDALEDGGVVPEGETRSPKSEPPVAIDVCPISAPLNNDIMCTMGTKSPCNYDAFRCEGSDIVHHGTKCSCRNGRFSCVMPRIICGEVVETAPPLPIDPVGCIACSDEPGRGMMKRKITCDGLKDRQLEKRCKKEKWIKKNTCQLSCDTTGYGYNNESCCDALE